MSVLFLCAVLSVYDGDGPIRCATGEKVRVAGIQAPDFQKAEPCRRKRVGYVCDDVRARQSQRIAASMLMGRRLICRSVDRSWGRVVAACSLPDGRDLSCALISAGAAVRWDSYWNRYNLRSCR